MRLHIRCSLVLMVFLCLCSSGIHAQYGPYTFQQLTTAEGLSNQFNAHFCVDRDGFFWTSSRDGLNRFDGQQVRIIRPTLDGKNTDPNMTSRVFQDRWDNKWFSSGIGLHVIEATTDSLRSWSFGNSYHYTFHLEQDSVLWLVANRQLYQFNTRTHALVKKHPYDTFVSYAIRNQAGQVTGLVRPLFDGLGGVEILRYEEAGFTADTLLREKVFATYLHVENDTSLWIPSAAGLLHLNPLSNDPPRVYSHAVQDTYGYLAIDAWGTQKLWIGSAKEGLLLFDKSRRQFVYQDTLIISGDRIRKLKTVNNLYVDENETLWLAVYNQGLFYTNLRRAGMSHIFPEPNAAVQSAVGVRSLAERSDGKIIVGSEQSTVYQISHPEKTNHTFEYSLASYPALPQSIVSISTDQKGNTWILTPKSIFRHDASETNFKLSHQNCQLARSLIELHQDNFLLLDNNRILEWKHHDRVTDVSELSALV
ncbi:MAG: hypothetical protein AAFO94_14065, partial [Bacteroidota bacterium]